MTNPALSLQTRIPSHPSAWKRRIIFSVGGKGGTGKSWVIALIILWLRSIGVTVAVVDTDDETSTTSRFFPDARFIRIRDPIEIDLIIQLALEGTASVVVVDLPARASNELEAWFQVVPWDDLREQGLCFSAIGVIAGTKDSIEAVIRWRDFIGSNVDFLVALNKRDDVNIYLGSNARNAFEAEHVLECVIPKLDERLTSALDKKNWTIAQALASTEPHLLTQIMSRARLRQYLAQVFAEFEKKKEILLP